MTGVFDFNLIGVIARRAFFARRTNLQAYEGIAYPSDMLRGR
jgi:hypothetical protein